MAYNMAHGQTALPPATGPAPSATAHPFAGTPPSALTAGSALSTLAAPGLPLHNAAALPPTVAASLGRGGAAHAEHVYASDVLADVAMFTLMREERERQLRLQQGPAPGAGSQQHTAPAASTSQQS